MKDTDLHTLIWLSRPLMQAAEAQVEAGLTGTGLTVRMRAVLEILHRHGDQTVPDIAARLDIKRQYVQLMVNDTLAAGLATEIANPRHKRSRLVVLSDRGRGLIEQIIARELALMPQIGAGLTEADIQTALTVLRTVTIRLKSLQGERT